MFQRLNKLKILKLLGSGMEKIEKIDSSGFKGLENLEELVLDKNNLTKLKSNLFQNLTKLKKLHF